MNIRFALRGAALCAALAGCYPAKAQDASAPAAIKVGAWSVVAADPRLAAAIGDMSGFEGQGGMAIAQEAQRRATKAGILSISAGVDESNRSVEIRAMPVKIRASSVGYGRFFAHLDGSPLEADAFQAAIKNAQSAARFNNDRLEVKLGSADQGAMPLDVEAVPTVDSRFGGALNLSTYGQRYSGRDLATLSAYANIGNDLQMSATLSSGLPNLRADSKGGNYASATIELNAATAWGLATVRANKTVYKSGGPLLPYDLHGGSTRLDFEIDHPLGASSSALLGFGTVRSTTEFRAAKLTGSQTFRYAMAGYRWQDDGASYGARIYRGLGGMESYNVAPLSGAFDPRFSAFQVDGRLEYDLGKGWAFDLAGAAQVGTKSTPGPMQFYGGGIDRGRAFNTGNIAGHSGVAGSATISKDLGGGFGAYAGVDAAAMRQALGTTATQSSMFAGIRGPLGSNGARFDIALAKAIKAPAGEGRSVGVMAMITLPF